MYLEYLFLSVIYMMKHFFGYFLAVTVLKVFRRT